MKIVLMGPPGSGKTTVGKMVAEKLDIPYISSGDIARSMNTPHGEMGDEQAMRQQIKSALTGCDSGFVLDGCPRFIEQAVWLNSVVGEFDLFCLAIESSVAISRLLKRGRKDDKHEIVIKRMAGYRNMTYPIIAAARAGNIDCELHVIGATHKSISKITEEIVELMGGE